MGEPSWRDARLLGALAFIGLFAAAITARRYFDGPSAREAGADREPEARPVLPATDRTRAARLASELQEFARELEREFPEKRERAWPDRAASPADPVRMWDAKRGRVYELPRSVLEGELPAPDELWDKYGIGTYDGSSSDGRTYDVRPRERRPG